MVRLAIYQGIVSPVVYGAATIVGGYLHPGYSHSSQAVSELTATGAPNQVWFLLAFALTELLKVTFGIGYFVAVRNASSALAGSAVVVTMIGAAGLWFARFPMDQIGTAMTFDGQMHIVIVSISAVLAIMALALAGFGWRSVPEGRELARWSFVLLAVMVTSGFMSGLVAANDWPGIGNWQRVNIGAFSLWQILTAVHLLRRY